VPTWLSNTPAPSADTVNDTVAWAASGESRLSVTATAVAPAATARPTWSITQRS
jgi:hypothetical protein